jgi:hypothetical protein
MTGDQLDIQCHSSIFPARQPFAAWPFSRNQSVAEMDIADVAVIGAGPYGLSVAAHLRSHAITHRIFGQPLLAWREHMPKRMLLKSEGFASNLSAPTGQSTLKHYCRTNGIAYEDTAVPVPLATFITYGVWFQKQYVPELELAEVAKLRADGDRFLLELNDGSRCLARSVVIAVGLTHFAHVPEVFGGLPRELVTHSSGHRDLSRFKGTKVLVVGSGASAIDIAAELADEGAEPVLIARSAAIRFHDPPGRRPFWRRLRSPSSGIGPGLRSWGYCRAPELFYHLPEKARLAIVRTHLGPAPGWFMRSRIEGQVPLLCGSAVSSVVATAGDKIRLCLAATDGSQQSVDGDHVIVATGYQVDLRRLPFIATDLRGAIRQVGYTPRLTTRFESSQAGLYFIGPAAANSFGPLLRFMVGAEFVAPRLASHLAARKHRKRK